MNPLFYNSYILFSDENMKKIENAKIALAGIGGVGSITLEMLARAGVQNFKAADNDKYAEVNLNRQLFAVKETIGKNKALAAKERLLSINPNCRIEVFEDGVTVKNMYDFCSDADIIMSIVDSEAAKTLMHRIAKKNRIPVIMGSRESLESASRWSVRAQLWDYKNRPDLKTFGETNHPEFERYPLEEITQEMVKEYDEKIKRKKIETFKKIALNPDNNFFKTIPQEELYRKLEVTPDAFNRHVCSVIANTAGCLAADCALRYIIGLPSDYIKTDLMQ